MKHRVLFFILCLIHTMASCTNDAQRKRVERDAGILLSAGGTVASLSGHPEYGIPASKVGGLLIRDGGK